MGPEFQKATYLVEEPEVSINKMNIRISIYTHTYIYTYTCIYAYATCIYFLIK